MEERIALLEVRVTGLEKAKDEFYEMKNSIARMEMVDNNIFDKLGVISSKMEQHRDTFEKHDEKEMEKYNSIDKRLARLEKVLYMGIGAGVVFQMLNSLHLLKIGG